MTRVLIADDHAVVRRGVKELLAEGIAGLDFSCVATIAETIEVLGREQFDLVILDLFMPGGCSFDLLQQARLTHPRLPILVLSSAPEEELGLRALRAGASGYLDKQAATEHLVAAARKVLEGGAYISASLAEQLAVEARRHGRPLHEDLSNREFQILHLVVEGRSLKEIAGALTLSVKTVRTFHARLLGKLHLQSDVDLVHYALNHGLTERRSLA